MERFDAHPFEGAPKKREKKRRKMREREKKTIKTPKKTKRERERKGVTRRSIFFLQSTHLNPPLGLIITN